MVWPIKRGVIVGMAFELGTTVGDYEFLGAIDRSASGVTFKVKNLIAQRLEALKVLAPNVSENEEMAERFLREVKIHAGMVHPHIVTFYNAGRLNGQLVMTTELVDGVTLAQRLRSGPVALEQALEWICQLLSALECAHGHGVIHRDITTEHILVAAGGMVKLAGFALARSNNDARLTQVGTVLGSLHYISPEQIQGLSNLDARTDIYSVGVVLYELVTGRKPFDSVSQFQLMASHVSEAPVPPIQLNRELSFELNHIVLQALAKQPDQRFQSASNFRERLESVQRLLNRMTQAAPLRPLPTVPAPAAPEPAPVVSAPIVPAAVQAIDEEEITAFRFRRAAIALVIMLGLVILLLGFSKVYR